MLSTYSGVLNTGRKRYGHPALLGTLPDPWLPIPHIPEPGTGTVLPDGGEVEGRVPEVIKEALVVDLRRRWSRVKKALGKGKEESRGKGRLGKSRGSISGDDSFYDDPSRAWRGSTPSDAGSSSSKKNVNNHREEDEEDEDDEEDYIKNDHQHDSGDSESDDDDDEQEETPGMTRCGLVT